MRSPDLLEVLDVAYRFDGDDATWLAGVATALRPALDVGCGIHAFMSAAGAPGTLRIDTPVSVGLTPDWEARWFEDWWRSFMLATAPPTLHRMMTHSVCNYSVHLWQALSESFPAFGPHLESHAAPPPDVASDGAMRYPDSLNLIALDASADGAIFAANRQSPATRPIARPLARTLSQLATHIAAALRLRRRKLGIAPLETADAIIDRDQRVVHASGEARANPALDAIRQAAVAVSRARPEEPGAAVKSLDESAAIEAWQSLTAGRWTVLDHFDRDGRRYFVARPNAPTLAGSEVLSARELQVLGSLALGHSNKLIAYELGLHPSTVSNHIAAAVRKLGVDSRLALVRRAKLLQGQAGQD